MVPVDIVATIDPIPNWPCINMPAANNVMSVIVLTVLYSRLVLSLTPRTIASKELVPLPL